VLFNILAPGVIEEHFTVGASKALSGMPGKVNFGVMYAPSKTITGPNPLEMPGQQQIQLKMNEWQIDFSYTVGF
jgi:long-chain fatty acid transport protein